MPLMDIFIYKVLGTISQGESNQFSKMLVIIKTGSAHRHVQVLHGQYHRPNVQVTMWESLLAIFSGIF